MMRGCRGPAAECLYLLGFALLQRGRALLGGVEKDDMETFGVELN